MISTGSDRGLQRSCSCWSTERTFCHLDYFLWCLQSLLKQVMSFPPYPGRLWQTLGLSMLQKGSLPRGSQWGCPCCRAEGKYAGFSPRFWKPAGVQSFLRKCRASASQSISFPKKKISEKGIASWAPLKQGYLCWPALVLGFLLCPEILDGNSWLVFCKCLCK